MKIAYVCTDNGVPVFGSKGSSIHVQEVVYGLIKRGASINLFASKIGGRKTQSLGAVEICELSNWPKDNAVHEKDLVSVNEILQDALEHAGPFDLVYERYSLWSFAAMEYARSIGVPGILEVNSPLIDEHVKYRGALDLVAAKAVANRVFGAASVLIAVSDAVASYLKRFSVTAGKVCVIPNGVNPERFLPNSKASSSSKRNEFKVGFVGTLKPWHGLSTLVDAFALLHQKAPESRLVIVGDGPEKENLIVKLAESKLLESTEFTGHVPPSQVPLLLSSLDVAVAPYPKLEQFYFSPLKVFEYMAAGLPVVVSKIGQLSELIQDGVNGILVPPGDAEALADALYRLRCEPELRDELGHMARLCILREHTWDMVVDRILDLGQVHATRTTMSGDI